MELQFSVYVIGYDCFPFPHRYAIRESNSVVKIFKNFKEKKSFKPDFGAESKCCLYMIQF